MYSTCSDILFCTAMTKMIVFENNVILDNTRKIDKKTSTIRWCKCSSSS